VLDVDALQIHPGEVLGIVGPSGAGKSTLLRLLNFLEFADSGTLTYRDRISAPGNIPLDVRREVTTVFQQPVLLSIDVTRNVAYGLRLRGIHDGRVPVERALARLGLADLAHTAARTLSGGEAQRVALARAMILHPVVLLLDEPTANLDPHNVNIIESVIHEMNEERATTIVLVTHNIFQARRLAHRVVLLLNGKIVEVSDTASFFDAPSDPRTAAFVNGEMVY
jgi:tungstate transport system ATP-binding protein